MIPVFLFLLFISLTAIPPGATNDHVSGIIKKVNEGVEGLIHGDIVQNGKNPCAETGCLWPKDDEHVKVPYEISDDFNEDQRQFIIDVLMTFEQSTCIRFVPKKEHHQDYIYFISGSGCWSYVGRLGERQDVSLRKTGCLHKGTVQHEVLHLLGLHHEQNRSDRDDHVIINYGNIVEALTEANVHYGFLYFPPHVDDTRLESNFNKVATNNLGTPYDFESVMQYSNYAFSANGEPTIIAKDDPDLIFGHAKEMNPSDITRVNLLYECNTKMDERGPPRPSQP